MNPRLWMMAIGIATVAVALPAHGQRRVTAPNAQLPADRTKDSVVRARLEGDIRRGFARAVRQRVGLSEEQMGRLVPLTQRHERDRRQLQVEDRDTRMSLRRMLKNEA